MYIYIYIIYITVVPVVPARGGVELALGFYYKTLLIYRPCMRPMPLRPVRACPVRTCCSVVVNDHEKFYVAMRIEAAVTCQFIKKKLHHSCSPVNIAKFLK